VGRVDSNFLKGDTLCLKNNQLLLNGR
jgi:hypothetical protein